MVYDISQGKADVPDIAQKLKYSLIDLSTFPKENLNRKSYLLCIKVGLSRSRKLLPY